MLDNKCTGSQTALFAIQNSMEILQKKEDKELRSSNKPIGMCKAGDSRL